MKFVESDNKGAAGLWQRVTRPVGKGDAGKAVWHFVRERLVFFLIVLLPTLLACVYYGFFASDVYISESKFLIRQPEKKTTSSLGMFLQSAGITSARDEIFTVREYMLSRDVVRILDEHLDLRKKFSRHDIDLFNRFNSLGREKSFEEFYEYYKNLVTIDVDTASSIGECKVKAFSPELAQSINEALLFLGEGFINNLNNRARQDLIRFNLEEVQETEVAAKEASLALSSYRNQQLVFDPKEQSTIQLQQIAKLQSDLIDLRSQLSQYKSFASQTPVITSLEKRRSDLEKEIHSETSKVMGSNNSMSQKLMEYDRRVMEVDFADKRLAAAMTSLQQSKSEAQRQQLYLEKVAMPNLPDMALYPRRGKDIVVIFLCSLIVYGIVKFFVMGVKEHQL